MNLKNAFFILLISLGGGYAGSWLFHGIHPETSQLTEGTLTKTHLPPTESFTAFPDDSSQSKPVHFSSAHRSFPSEGFSEASALSRASVVYIKSITATSYPRQTWFDLFFGQSYNEKRVMGSGSGVIFSADGYIVTNNHVIEGADKIEVVHNKRTYQAELVGTDPSTDLALLKVNATNLPAVSISRSANLEVGDWVLAVGNPFNLESTVTAGIVSAKGRRINILEDIFPIESFIQTDAAINPGNSGGALVNQRGELVGINTAILSQNGSYAGYGFAVPSDIVVKVMRDLKEFGEVQKAFIGATVRELDEELSNRLNLSELNGMVVMQVEKAAEAEKAGLQQGDIIVKIDNYPIDSKSSFDEKLSYHRPGETVTITYQRSGKTYQANLVLTNIEGTTDIIRKVVYDAKNLGAVFEAVPKMERSRLGISSGIRIKEVKRGLISRMGLPEGFIITAINNYPLEKPEDLAEILERIRGRVIIRGVTKDGYEKFFSYLF